MQVEEALEEVLAQGLNDNFLLKYRIFTVN